MTRAILLLLIFFCTDIELIGQVPDAATKLYNQGVLYFAAGDYVLADEQFSKAITIYTWPDVYYNKAAVSYKLKDMESFCINLKLGADLGDNECRDRFKMKCTTTDTIFRNIDSVVCQKEEAAFREVIVSEPYISEMCYTKFVNDTAILSYCIQKGDTIYTLSPNLKLPEFPGGEMALVKYLSANIKYPAYARENGISGTVFASFIVDGNGDISDVTILRGISIDANKEVLRVVSNMPKWTPGNCEGKIVRAQFNLPVRFTLRQN